MASLFDRPSRFAAPRLATPRVPTRNDLLAERERLARQEREAAARLDKLRGELDELSNQLGVAGPAPMRHPSPIPRLWMVNQDRARRGLPPLTELPALRAAAEARRTDRCRRNGQGDRRRRQACER